MYVVDHLFAGNEYRTEVWIAEKPAKELAKFKRKGDGLSFSKKLKRYAERGFREYEGDKSPIRSEWNDVWRVGHSSTLFRLIGFYEDDDKEVFIAIDAFTPSPARLCRLHSGSVSTPWLG